MITFYCKDCHERIVVDDSKAGKAHVCPLCGITLRVPGGQSTAVAKIEPVPARPVAPTVVQSVADQADLYQPVQIMPHGPQPPTVVVIQQPMQIPANTPETQSLTGAGEDSRGLATASLIVSVVALLFFCPLCILTLIFGGIVWHRALTRPELTGGRGMALASVIVSLVGVGFMSFAVAVWSIILRAIWGWA